MSALDSDTLINMKIQEQMKRYELNKQLKETLDEQQKNHIKQKVWDQLFNQSSNSTQNPQQSLKYSEAPSFNEEDAWQQRKSFVSQIQRSNPPQQTKTATLNQNWFVDESRQTDQNEEIQEDQYVYEEEEEYQGNQWQNEWDPTQGSIVQSNIQASRAPVNQQQSSSQYPKLQFIDKWYEEQNIATEQSQFPTVSKLPSSNLKESMAPEEKYAFKQKQNHFKTSSNIQANDQKQEFLSQFLINKQPQFIENISTISREEQKEQHLHQQKQSLLERSKLQASFAQQSQAQTNIHELQEQSQHFKNWRGNSTHMDNQMDEKYSVSKQASFVSRQQNESRDYQYTNQISQMQSKVKPPSFSNYEQEPQRKTETSQVSKPANSFLNISNPYLNKFEQHGQMSELEKSYEMGRTQSKLQAHSQDYHHYTENQNVKDPDQVDFQEEGGDPYQYEDEHSQNGDDSDYENRGRVDIIDSLHEAPPIDKYEDPQEQEEQHEEPQNKFIQFEIGLDQSDADIKKRKFEMLKRKKMEEMERAKQERQKKRQEEQHELYECNTPVNKKSHTPQRERSPVMPSAKGRINDADRQTTPKSTTPTNPKTLRNEKVNIFQEDPQDKYNHFQMNRQQRPPKDDNIVPPRQNPKNPFRELGSRPTSGRPNSGVPTDNPSKGSRNNSQNRQVQKPELTPTIKSKKNNKMMLKNAITNVCLAGEPNKKERQLVLEQFETLEAEHFIILLKGQFGRMDLKAIYGMQSQDHPPELLFQCQKSPIQLDPQLVHQYFKYDSGAKEFKPIAGNKNFSYVVDAVKLRK